MLQRLKLFLSVHPEAPLSVQLYARFVLVMAGLYLLSALTDLFVIEGMADLLKILGGGILSAALYLILFYGLSKLKKWGLYLGLLLVGTGLASAGYNYFSNGSLSIGVLLTILLLTVLVANRKKFQY